MIRWFDMRIKMSASSTGGRPFSKTYDHLNIDKSIVPELITIVKNNGIQLLQGAQKRSPVDTGALRRSIRLSLENGNLKAVVKTNVPYAKFVEYETIRQKAQPFMRPSLRVQKVKFIRDIKNAIWLVKKGG